MQFPGYSHANYIVNGKIPKLQPLPDSWFFWAVTMKTGYSYLKVFWIRMKEVDFSVRYVHLVKIKSNNNIVIG